MFVFFNRACVRDVLAWNVSVEVKVKEKKDNRWLSTHASGPKRLNPAADRTIPSSARRTTRPPPSPSTTPHNVASPRRPPLCAAARTALLWLGLRTCTPRRPRADGLHRDEALGQLVDGQGAEHGPGARAVQDEEPHRHVCAGNKSKAGTRRADARRNYVFSVMIGFVALTYGSVPMYKMVRRSAVDRPFG